MFSMTGLLAKFGMVMLLVMLGFVTSFYSLFQETIAYGVVRQLDEERCRQAGASVGERARKRM